MKSQSFVYFLIAISILVIGLYLYSYKLDSGILSITNMLFALFLGCGFFALFQSKKYYEIGHLKEGASFQLIMWDTTFSHDGYAPGKWTLMTILVKKEWVLLVVYSPNILCTLKENSFYFVRNGKIRSENYGKPEVQEESIETKNGSGMAGPCI